MITTSSALTRRRRKMTTSQKIRRMLSKGMPPREIAARLNTNVQNVYNVQYQDRKKGIASLPAATPTAPATPAPATPAPTAPQTLGDLIKQEQAKVEQPAPQPVASAVPIAPTPAVFVADTSASRYLPDLPAAAPAPSLWQRVLGWFGWR